MDQVILACQSAADYPRNLVKSNTYEFVATSYSDRLDECEHDLFGNENSAALYFWDFGDGAKGMYETQLRSRILRSEQLSGLIRSVIPLRSEIILDLETAFTRRIQNADSCQYRP